MSILNRPCVQYAYLSMNIQSAISLILAPVVMISTSILFMNGLIQRYEALGARLRALHVEHIELLRALRSNQEAGNCEMHTPTGSLCDLNKERLNEIEYELLPLMRRHRLMCSAIVSIGIAISIEVLCMFVIGIHALTQTGWLQWVSLTMLLGGAGVFLISVLLTSFELTTSPREVVYEVQHGLKLSR